MLKGIDLTVCSCARMVRVHTLDGMVVRSMMVMHGLLYSSKFQRKFLFKIGSAHSF